MVSTNTFNRRIQPSECTRISDVKFRLLTKIYRFIFFENIKKQATT